MGPVLSSKNKVINSKVFIIGIPTYDMTYNNYRPKDYIFEVPNNILYSILSMVFIYWVYIFIR